MDSVSHQRAVNISREFEPAAKAKESRHAEVYALANVENSNVRSLLEELLLKPTLELRARPSHEFRAQIVNIGAELATLPYGQIVSKDELQLCAEAIEQLHLGSLIVDDIQDGSPVRRNGPSLHTRLGMPHALSVGNWLYFRALRSLEKLDLDPSRRQFLNKEWHEAMELAHYGQVMDLSVSMEQVPRDKLVDVCYHCALYKTGSIVALAIGMGALVQGASPEKIHDIKKLGAALGVYLQQLNDIGNIIGDFDNEKRFEDLISLKPSYVWGLTLEKFGTSCFERLYLAARALPNATLMEAWVQENALQAMAEEHAENLFQRALDEFQDAYPLADLTRIKKLKDRIRSAYA